MVFTFPQGLKAKPAAIRRIKRFYEHERRVRDRRKRRLEASFEILPSPEGILSLWRDIRSQPNGDEPTVTVRYADSWSLYDGLPVFPKLSKKEKRELTARISGLAKERPNYYKSSPRAIKRLFSEGSCVMTDKGIAVFFQQNTIAPSTEGFCVFDIIEQV